jgi:hypothetical protein
VCSFLCVCFSQDKDDDDDMYKIVPDPLGLNAVDLQATQAMHLSGALMTD